MIGEIRHLPARRLCASYSIGFAIAMMLGSFSSANADNVLLIIADDLGADSVGLFSTASVTAPTPTLDSLAANGVRFTRCWANPTCSPSRASLLTGRHGFRTGVGTPGHVIDLSEGTVADAFKNAGYQTACVGKWHLSNSSNGGNDNPNLMGFDHYCGPPGGGVPNYVSWTKVVNGVTQQPQVSTYATTENVNDAIDWIDDQNSDWFLWLAFNAPHTPFHLPPNDLHTDSLSGTAADIAANPRPYYRAAVEAMDTEIGRLLSSIDPVVLANTTIVFVGDNGTPGQVSPRVVRGAKGQLWEGGVNVPCIVSGPAVSGNLNRANDANIHLVDMFKTLLEIAGLDANLHTPAGAATDSKSFAGYLVDQNLANAHPCQFTTRFSTTTVPNDGKAIANDDFKLIQYDDGDEEFFNRADEFTNLLDGSLTGIEVESYMNLIEKMAALIDPPKVVSVVRDNGSVVRPDLLNTLEVVFNQHVNVSAADLLMRNDSTLQMRDLTGAGYSYDATTFTATWDLGSLSSPLEAAFYTLELVSNDITSVDDDTALDGDGDGMSGPNYDQSLYVAIPGDTNLDGQVDVLGDAIILVDNLGSSSGVWAQGDFNGDGNITVLGDAVILVDRLGQSVQSVENERSN